MNKDACKIPKKKPKIRIPLSDIFAKSGPFPDKKKEKSKNKCRGKATEDGDAQKQC